MKFLSVLAVLAGLLPCAGFAASGEKVLFDLDFTKGESVVTRSGVTVIGGKWEQGWRVTGHGQRIILDAGRTLKNGVLEVWFTKHGSPINADGVKGQWLSLHELDGGLSAEYVQLRAGHESYGFSKLRSKSNEQGFSTKLKKVTHKRCEVKAGTPEDWVTDDRTVMRVTIRWQNGVVSFTTPDGKDCACTKYAQFEPPYLIDALRYAYLGSDETENGGSLPGLRFTRVRFAELSESK